MDTLGDTLTTSATLNTNATLTTKGEMALHSLPNTTLTLHKHYNGKMAKYREKAN